MAGSDSWEISLFFGAEITAAKPGVAFRGRSFGEALPASSCRRRAELRSGSSSRATSVPMASRGELVRAPLGSAARCERADEAAAASCAAPGRAVGFPGAEWEAWCVVVAVSASSKLTL